MDELLQDWARDAVTKAATNGRDVASGLDLALSIGRRLPHPGNGDTAARWAVLAALGRANLTVARIVEAHTDALAVLGEAGMTADHGRTWGVFAAESRTDRLEARDDGDGVTLHGSKPWCSLGDVLDSALVTAWAGDERQLFAIDLRHPGVHAQPASGWVSRGLPSVVSVGLRFDRVPAKPVCDPGWYLRRAGFAWGGMGVAACWFGGALGVADMLDGAADDLLGDLARGRAAVALHAARCVLDAAAADVDAGRAAGAHGATLALHVRAVVADAAETVLAEVAHSCGPAPLAFDERHAARVADLQIYLRQHHAERDLAALGRLTRESPS